jgi:hypothetical protein
MLENGMSRVLLLANRKTVKQPYVINNMFFLLHRNCFLLINMLEDFIKYKKFQEIKKL